MRLFLFFVVLVLTTTTVARSYSTKVHMGGRGPNLILSPLPHENLELDDLPTYWDIRNISGVNYASPIRSQMVPQFCGACWAFASTSSLNDRLKLMRKNAYPDFQLSPQAILNCGSDAGTCDGGSPYAAFEYIAKNPIGDETCSPYRADDLICNAADRCEMCDDSGCVVIANYPLYSVSEYGSIPAASPPTNLSMETQMMMEVYARGPIACAMYYDEIFFEYTGGIMTNRPWSELNHIVTVSGWGEETDSNGTSVAYWIVRNSFGTWWGEFGWFRIQRGVNALGIESGCSWAVPTIPPPFNY